MKRAAKAPGKITGAELRKLLRDIVDELLEIQLPQLPKDKATTK